MSKPDWCPQRVWDEACGCFDAFSATGLFRDYEAVEAKIIVARAILAAEQREREACARMVETGEGWMKSYHHGHGAFSKLIAAAIRNRGTEND